MHAYRSVRRFSGVIRFANRAVGLSLLLLSGCDRASGPEERAAAQPGTNSKVSLKSQIAAACCQGCKRVRLSLPMCSAHLSLAGWFENFLPEVKRSW